MGSIGPELLRRLFDAHAPALRLYARQWCDGADADDAVQEAFVSLARQAALPDRVGAWLHRVVRNAAVSAARGRSRRRRREARVSIGEAWFSTVDDEIDARDATRYLAELATECREAIVARLWGGLTFDQIARLQGCSLTTAFRHYQDGLSRLHERLERPCSTGTKTEPNR
jgi:RNA polymerase sigma-70 factor (ECF subfamily)